MYIQFILLSVLQTYIGFSTSGVSDPVEKIALDTMVRTYGQMPKQLLKQPHPFSNPVPPRANQQIYPFVNGLRWGIYTGSPQMSEPHICYIYQQFEMNFAQIVSLPLTNVCYGAGPGCNIMQGTEPDTMNIISWQEPDGVVRIKPLTIDEHVMAEPLLLNDGLDTISCCGTDAQSNQLWFGHVSGKITVYECSSVWQDKLNKSRYYQHSSSLSKMSYNSAFRKISSKGTYYFYFFDNFCFLTFFWFNSILLKILTMPVAVLTNITI